jgi:hypothetical protein
LLTSLNFPRHARPHARARLDPLLARGKCVLSEWSNDPTLDQMYAPAVVFAPYNRLLEATHALLAEGEPLSLPHSSTVGSPCPL